MAIKTSSDSVIIGLAIITLMVLLLIFGPLAIIWSLNTLFPILAIPFGFYQWAAVMLLNGVVFGKTFISTKG
jgi:hypothetical protein